MNTHANTPAPASADELIAFQQLARRQADLYRHLLYYVATNILLWSINLWQIREGGFMQTEKWWAIIVTLAWGFGVLTNGLSVWMSSMRRTPFVSIDWEEKKVRELMQKNPQEPNK